VNFLAYGLGDFGLPSTVTGRYREKATAMALHQSLSTKTARLFRSDCDFKNTQSNLLFVQAPWTNCENACTMPIGSGPWGTRMEKDRLIRSFGQWIWTSFPEANSCSTLKRET